MRSTNKVIFFFIICIISVTLSSSEFNLIKYADDSNELLSDKQSLVNSLCYNLYIDYGLMINSSTGDMSLMPDIDDFKDVIISVGIPLNSSIASTTKNYYLLIGTGFNYFNSNYAYLLFSGLALSKNSSIELETVVSQNKFIDLIFGYRHSFLYKLDNNLAVGVSCCIRTGTQILPGNNYTLFPEITFGLTLKKGEKR